MDLHETTKPTTDDIQANYEQTSHQDENFAKMSPSKEEKNPGQTLNNSESHIPNSVDSEEKFIGEKSVEHIDIPHEEEEAHPVQNGASPKNREEDFDFEKKLPEIPHGNERNESETQMKFSATHFQDDESVEEDNHTKPEIKQEEYSHANVEEDDEEDQEEVIEPAQEVSHSQQQEKFPEVDVAPVKQEEIFTPSPSHRSPSPVPVSEEPKQEEHFKSPESPAAEKLISTSPSCQPDIKPHQAETAKVADLVEPPKTRSVKSTKSEGTGRSFLVVDLVYWRDPRKSGIVLGAVLAILLSLSVVSVVSVFSYSALAVLTGTLSFRLYKNVLQAVQKTQDGHPFKEYLEKDVTVTSEKMHEVADLTAAKLNGTLVELRRLFLVEDLVDSVKFALVLWALTYVGSWFNGLTLVILGVIGLFSLPKVYETHQEKIDQNVDLVRGKINDIVDKVQAVLPIGKKVKSQ